MAPKAKPNVYQQYVPPSGGGMFFKFEDGKPVRLRIAGPPYVFISTFERGGEVTNSTKYAWVIYNKEEDRVQILQLPVTAFRQVQALAQNEEWGDPTEYDLVVMRRGTGRETEYTISPSPNRASLMNDQQAKVEAVDLKARIPNAILLSEAVAGREVKAADQDTASVFEGADQLSEQDIPAEYQ